MISTSADEVRPTRSNSRGEAARNAMLDAAEELACTSGLGAITLTAVQQRAGQGNKSAASYHFGSRDGLLRAVIARRMGPIDEHRTRLLDSIDPQDPSALAEALVRPLAEATVLVPESRYARFAAQAFIDPTLASIALGHEEAQSLRRVQALITDLLVPRLGAAVTAVRIGSVTGLAVTTLALVEGHPALRRDLDLVDDLVRTVTAALLA